MQKILVPTDFSECAENAFKYAIELARKGNARIILMHSCDLLEHKFSRYEKLIIEHNQTLTADLFQNLHELKKRLGQNTGIEIETRVYKSNSITEGILQAAKDAQAEIIVIGTQGATGITKKLLGTQAASIINKSKVPVLTIPPHFRWNEPKNILLAIEDMEDDIQTLKPLADLIALLQANCIGVTFTKTEAEAFEMVTHAKNIHFIEEKLHPVFNDTSFETIHLTGENFRDSIQQLIEEKKIDMLAMITHERSFIENIYNASLTQKMSYNISVPLFSIRSECSI